MDGDAVIDKDFAVDAETSWIERHSGMRRLPWMVKL